MQRLILTIGLALFFFGIGRAQKIQHLEAFRSINSERYFRFHYDNDFFAATDEIYTQGYHFEFVAPVFSKNPLNFMLLKPEGFKTKFGLSLEHIGFTPNHYELPEIQYGDRPFASAIMLKSFSVSTHTQQKLRWHSSLSLGLIGPGAFGEEMQVGIHKWTGNKTPLGWRHQIKNDVVINYQVGIEKQVFQFNDILFLQAQSTLDVGSLFTNISAGANLVVGQFENVFSSEAKEGRFQIYAYAQPVVTAVGHDATLQGGLFNTRSPYTISNGNLERFTAQFNFGLVIQTKRLYFEYSRSSISKEFETGETAKWGGFRVGYRF
ncbi:lipid A deacylase LpxR family protein [Subsaximicrobium wynnwilliamsii]|uniref:Lipid A deacylase LpxR family protein n=1 Tax=Subsaximicrobium wynnwilliamsii TaxID=291179 RepID=A0A5C6ZPJ1_9FLAO|nr:lipid A deacylase LpxR family protein [Subsaximicrobium wynnwilliamsii]TXD84899.1 lipid A deacylase LpxR family protein [Subsaximicrobium wynnwilliamsii]TXD90570.1 lipid A deacylase LpxR family protein [Subsaximicrobium wynnwilliamsii]TXE05045.1 lipid A deacylase LpxR family protein [Subsaximicrobium wynnwilliamsii]